MSLLTYRDVRPWAAAIRDKVSSRAMPPWHADPHYGTFRNNRALSLEETIAYIEHRIRVAGGTRNPFDRRAMEEIHILSGGLPRLINTLATTALLDAFGEDAPTIDPSRVAAAAREHHMESAHG